jgi:hypothetical protein
MNADRLNEIAGDRGTVQWSAARFDPTHRAVGWYLRPRLFLHSCRCEYCAAAREGLDVFVATGTELAAFLLRDYDHAHRHLHDPLGALPASI